MKVEILTLFTNEILIFVVKVEQNLNSRSCEIWVNSLSTKI